MANQFGSMMQAYNTELTKFKASYDIKGIDELKIIRTSIQAQIKAEEDEKSTLQKEVERMSYRINLLNDSLNKKISTCSNYDRTISETESAYNKILESFQLLLNMVKREADCLDETLQEKSKGTVRAPL